MTLRSAKQLPVSAMEAFDQVRMEIPRNETSRRMDDPKVYLQVLEAMKDLGHRRLINLAHSYEQSRIAHAFYRGDGVVVKVIPEDYLGAPNVIRHLPSITSHSIKAGDRGFRIKTYPWLAGTVTQEDIEDFRAELLPLGVAFVKDDDHPGNVRRMPDKNRTLVGIDSFMYEFDPANRKITQEMEDAWHKYVHRLFPIYDESSIPAQTEHTDFNFVSAHDPNAVTATYNIAPVTTMPYVQPVPQTGGRGLRARLAQYAASFASPFTFG